MNTRRWILPSLCLAAGFAAAGAQTPEPPAGQPATAASPAGPNSAAVPGVDLIPRDVLFGNPDKAAGRLSPDGKHVSFLAPVDGVLNVWVGPADDISKARPITRDTVRGIRQYFWAYTNNHILYLQDKGGDENWKVYCVDLATNQEKDLTPFETIPGPDGEPIVIQGKALRPSARIEAVSEKFPEEILIGLNNRDPRFHDVHRVNITTGEMTLVQRNDRFAGFLTDDDYRIRLALEMTPDGGMQIHKAVPGAAQAEGMALEFEPWQKIAQEDTLTTATLGFDLSGDVLYMTDSRGRDTGALTAVNLITGEQTVLAASDKADAGSIIVHPTRKHVQAVSFNYLRNEWKVLDPAIEPDLAYLKTVADGEILVTSRTFDDKRWTVAYILDDGPARTYLYDRDAKKATLLYTNRKALEGLPLAKMHPVVITSRDGLDLVCYLTLPVGSDTDGDLRPDRPLPMILNVHGGPWGRDTWGYHPEHQWLANRGYACLSVNFRGSTGFGKKFVNAGDREWAGRMHDDLIDAVNWAIEKGIADKNRVGIMGGSYGGYATLVGLTFTPDVFAAGVDIVGPSNIVTLLNTIPAYWQPMIELFAKRVGDHRTEEGRKFLESRSPLTYVDRIKKPLLIGQGANDPRVKQSEADQIVEAMQAKNIPVTYVLYPDEGHGFDRPENRMSFYAVTEAFLAQHLGGRYEPIGDDFENSSIQIPVGAEHVPGLESFRR
jgi:dipeptidyl aminopeptidase/acylaminoacyl peptidase